MKIILITTLLILSSCGYKPMYSKDTINNFYFKEIELIGNKTINQKLINSGLLLEDKNVQSNKKLIIDSKLIVIETSKDSEGLVETYRSILNVNLTFLENNVSVKNKTFSRTFSYPNKSNRFELLEYQNTVEKNLTSEIIKDLIIFFNINDS